LAVAERALHPSVEIASNLFRNLLQSVVGRIRRLGRFLAMQRESYAEMYFSNAAAHHLN
jgi:hypothetical protein